jgi:serine/threonine protein kinase
MSNGWVEHRNLAATWENRVRECTLFINALEIPTAEGRRSFLREMCGENAALMHRVEQLLRMDAVSEGVVDRLARAASHGSDSWSELVGELVLPRTDFRLEQGFHIVRRLGAGALGEVFEARIVALPDHAPIALKILRNNSNAMPTLARANSLREAQTLTGLQHSRIVKLFAAGESQQHGPFIAMELVPGVDLARWIAERGPIPDRVAVESLKCVASAVAAMHSVGLAHCDIKPGNILGCCHRSERATIGDPAALDLEKLKLGDLGLAMTVSRAEGVSGGSFVGGTLQFMPPEQLMSNRPDVRWDVFALGATLLYMLNGGPIALTHSRRDEAVTTDQRCEATSNAFGLHLSREEYADRLTQTLSELQIAKIVTDRYLRAIVLRAVALSPEDRYPSVDELLSDLDDWQNDRKAEHSGFRYTWRDRWLLLLRRARRPEESFAVDQATMWGIGFLSLAPWAIGLSAYSTWLRLGGMSYTDSFLRTSLPFHGLVALVGVVLLVLTRCNRVMWQVYGYLLATALSMALLRRLYGWGDTHELATAGIVLHGMSTIVIGLFSRLWKTCVWLGAGVLAIAAASHDWLSLPANAPWGDFLVGICFALVFLVLGIQYAVAGPLSSVRSNRRCVDAKIDAR